jgi:ribosomal protein S27AE
MNVADLLSELAHRCIRLVAGNDGRLGAEPGARLTSELRAAIIEHKTALLTLLRGGSWPIIAGTQHWNPYLPGDFDGPWGEEFVPGLHVDLRAPSRLPGLCSAPGVSSIRRDESRAANPTTRLTCGRCGSSSWRDVPIHCGQSTRRDCARCGRFMGFPVWYGTLQNET